MMPVSGEAHQDQRQSTIAHFTVSWGSQSKASNRWNKSKEEALSSSQRDRGFNAHSTFSTAHGGLVSRLVVAAHHGSSVDCSVCGGMHQMERRLIPGRGRIMLKRAVIDEPPLVRPKWHGETTAIHPFAWDSLWSPERRQAWREKQRRANKHIVKVVCFGIWALANRSSSSEWYVVVLCICNRS